MTPRRHVRIVCAAWLALSLAACAPEAPNLAQLVQAPTPQPTAAPSATPSPAPSATAEPSATPTPRPTATPTPTPSTTAEPLPHTPTLAPLAAARRADVLEQAWELVRDRYVYTDYRGLDWDAVRAEYAPRVAAA